MNWLVSESVGGGIVVTFSFYFLLFYLGMGLLAFDDKDERVVFRIELILGKNVPPCVLPWAMIVFFACYKRLVLLPFRF